MSECVIVHVCARRCACTGLCAFVCVVGCACRRVDMCVCVCMCVCVVCDAQPVSIGPIAPQRRADKKYQ